MVASTDQFHNVIFSCLWTDAWLRFVGQPWN